MTDHDDAKPTGYVPKPIEPTDPQMTLGWIAAAATLVGLIVWVAAFFIGQDASDYDLSPMAWMNIGGKLIEVGVLFFLGYLVVGGIRYRRS